jgi:hypothetical protein
MAMMAGAQAAGIVPADRPMVVRCASGDIGDAG